MTLVNEVSKPRLAFIGLGNMGGGVAARLAEQGYPMTVYNRTASKAQPVVEAGATQADSPSDAAAAAEIVLLSLSDEDAVEEVLFAEVLAVLPRGTTVIDTSTVSPSYARSAGARLADAGMRRVEAALIGNPLQARAGELRILTAGEGADVAAVEAILHSAGREVVHLGATGNALTLKLMLNLLLGAQLTSFVEALSYGERAGLDRAQMLDVMTATTGFASEVLRFRARFIREGSYEPAAFRAALMDKDLRLVLTEAKELGVHMPVIAETARRFTEVVERGDGHLDAAAVMALHEQRE